MVLVSKFSLKMLFFVDLKPSYWLRRELSFSKIMINCIKLHNSTVSLSVCLLEGLSCFWNQIPQSHLPFVLVTDRLSLQSDWNVYSKLVIDEKQTLKTLFSFCLEFTTFFFSIFRLSINFFTFLYSQRKENCPGCVSRNDSVNVDH